MHPQGSNLHLNSGEPLTGLTTALISLDACALCPVILVVATIDSDKPNNSIEYVDKRFFLVLGCRFLLFLFLFVLLIICICNILLLDYKYMASDCNRTQLINYFFMNNHIRIEIC
jgi:hypothetical protein